MDGGTQSWAWSKERLLANLDHISHVLADEQADFLLVQEVDTDSTRSYHVNELDVLNGVLAQGYDQTFARNYDSPFLFYPITQPHGASKAGIATYAAFPIDSALRRSLPIEEGFTKFLDLDRCYSVSRIPVEGGHELVLYNLHLSAYTSDGTIAVEQLELLLGDMQAEYEKGNYCVAGGDFNKDLLGDSSVYFGASDIAYTWAQPIPEGTFDAFDIRLMAPLDESAPVPSCRNADGPYHEGQYVLTVDGFLVSPNVEVTGCNVIDLQFQYSDHNPVYLDFTLK
jgi:endonuclease/exonuclease/phosphatase family metal-dependent hydrolase